MIKISRNRSLGFCPQEDLQAPILAWLGEAKVSVHVSMYTFTSLLLASALVALKRQGVDVKCFLDSSQARPMPPLGIVRPSGSRYDSGACEDLGLPDGVNEGTVLATLQTGGVVVTFGESTKHAINHSKYAVRDGSAVVWGSANWTLSGLLYQCNQISFEQSLPLAKVFEADFAANFARGTPTP